MTTAAAIADLEGPEAVAEAESAAVAAESSVADFIRVLISSCVEAWGRAAALVAQQGAAGEGLDRDDDDVRTNAKAAGRACQDVLCHVLMTYCSSQYPIVVKAVGGLRLADITSGVSDDFVPSVSQLLTDMGMLSEDTLLPFEVMPSRPLPPLRRDAHSLEAYDHCGEPAWVDYETPTTQHDDEMEEAKPTEDTNGDGESSAVAKREAEGSDDDQTAKRQKR